MKAMIRFCLLVAATVLSAVGEANAFGYSECQGDPIRYPGHSITFRPAEISFPAGSKWLDMLMTAFGRWNQAVGDFTFNPPITGENEVSRKNGENEIWFTEDADLLNGSPGMIFKRFLCLPSTAKIKELDIAYIWPGNWSGTEIRDNKKKYLGKFRPIVTGLMHELGHGFGLSHTNYTYNVMGEDQNFVTANGGFIRAYAGEDATQGMVFLYGERDTEVRDDFSVTHWKYYGKDEEYSTHTRTRVYAQGTEDELPFDGYDGMRRYYVSPGGTYDFQFTYESNGLDTQYLIPTGYYLSKNSRITTHDPLIRQIMLKKLSMDSPYTQKTTLELPDDLKSETTYWIGVIVDNFDQFVEVTENNNASFIPIYVP